MANDMDEKLREVMELFARPVDVGENEVWYGFNPNHLSTEDLMSAMVDILHSPLTAAAPELLKSLEGFLNYSPRDMYDPDFWAAAEAAIKKAKGE